MGRQRDTINVQKIFSGAVSMPVQGNGVNGCLLQSFGTTPIINYHSALGRSPFEVLYGHPPKHFGITNDSTFHSFELEQWLIERNFLNDCIQHHLHRAQQRMKSQDDKNRSERDFQVGDSAYLKLQPYVQSSVAPWSNMEALLQVLWPLSYSLESWCNGL